MRPVVLVTFAMLAAGCMLPLVMRAQQAGSKRTDLQRYELSFPGREIVQVRVDFAPGYAAPKHRHPGEEVVYVIEGVLEYLVEGRAPKTYRAGEALTIPAGVIHTARNVGPDNAAELATYIVEIGKPLLEITE